MDAILSRLPTQSEIRDWGHRNRGKIGGLVAGTLGLWIVTTFLMVAITGVPFGGERLPADRTIVYPNF